MSDNDNPESRHKIDAIYSLREAAEAKAFAEMKVEIESTPSSRDKLLDAQLELESKTQDAIEACHECGHVHASFDPHFVDNLVSLDFDNDPKAD